MSDANRALAVRWFEEVWNHGKESAVEELASPRLRWYGFPKPDSVIGMDAFMSSLRAFHRSFSGIHITLEETVCEDSRVAVRWTARATHTGGGLGFAATGLPVTVPGISILHFHDGLLQEGYNAFDITTALNRLSAIAAARD